MASRVTTIERRVDTAYEIRLTTAFLGIEGTT
jgi:hypothetical protein